MQVYNNLAQEAETQELSQEFLEGLYQKLSLDSHDDVRLSRKEFNALLKLILDNIQFKMHGGMYEYSSELNYEANNVVLFEGQLFMSLSANGPDTEKGVTSPQDQTTWANIAKSIMDLTDTEVLSIINQKINNLQSDVSSLNVFKNNVRDYIPKTKVDAIDDYLDVLKAQNAQQDIDIETNSSDLVGVHATLTELQETMSGALRDIHTAQGDIQDGINRDVRTDAKVLELQETTADHETRVKALETLTSSHDESVIDHETRIQTLEEISKTFQDKSAHENDLTLLTNRVNTNLDSITALQEEVQQLREDMLQGDTNTRKKLYDELINFGEQGEYLNVVWNDELQQNGISSKPLIYKMNMSYTADQLALLKLHPVSMSTIFSEWQRFAHTGRANTEANQIENTKKAWSYDKSTGEISSNINSSVFGGFVSPTKHRQYYLKVKLRGNDTDNDIIGIVCAFYTDDNGVEHTLSVIRAKMIENHTLYRYGLVYDYGKTTEKIIAERNDVIPDVTGGWEGNYVIVDALRTGSRLVVKTSNINSDVLLPASEIDFTLPEVKPEDWSDEMYSTINTMLQNPMQVGFGVFSENGRFTVLDQKYIFDDNDIYDILNDQILRYVEKTSTWQVIGKVTDKLEDNILVWSPNINTLFLYAHGGVQVVSTSSEWANGKDLPMSSINNSLTALQNKNTEQDNNIQSIQSSLKKATTQDIYGSQRILPQNAVFTCSGDSDIMITSDPDFCEFKIFLKTNGYNVTVQGLPVTGVVKIEGFSLKGEVYIDIKTF